MLPFILLLLSPCIMSLSAQETTPAEDQLWDFLNSPRIVGGQYVNDRSQYAYQVSLRYYGTHFCGASIVSTQHILTAAHCCYIKNVIVDAAALTAIVGDLFLTASSDTVSKTITSVIVHENYDANTITNDIALMKLTTAFEEWTNTIKPIALATTVPESGTDCTVSGWGYTEESGRISEVLQTVTVPLIDTTSCMNSYGNSIQSGMICAGYTGGGKDACQGDSGGPLVCNYTLTGVVSWGSGCARENYPGVYTDVAYYYAWIQEKIEADFPVSSISTVVSTTESYSSNGIVWTHTKLIIFLASLLLNVLQYFL